MTVERLPGEPDADRELDRRGARRAVDGVGLERRPGVAAGHDAGPQRRRPGQGAGRQRAEGPPRERDLAPARAREARDRPLLLREPDPARDRRGPRRHRVPRLPAAHEGRPAAEVAPPERSRSMERAAIRCRIAAPADSNCLLRRAVSFEEKETAGGAQGRSAHQEHRDRRAPRVRQDLAERGAAVRGRRRSTGSAPSPTAAPSPTPSPTSRQREMSIAREPLVLRVRGPQDQPDRHARRAELRRRGARRAERLRERGVLRQRRDGRRGLDRPPVGARRRARPGAARVREHARPRAGRLLPHARLAQGRLRAARRRDRDPDRLRARAARHRRPDRHEGLRVLRRRARERDRDRRCRTRSPTRRRSTARS